MGKRGQPTKFNVETTAKMMVLYRQGKTDKEIAELTGIGKSTIELWKKTYPEFLDALKTAKDNPDDLVEASLFNLAQGYSCKETKVFCAFGKVTTVDIIKHYPPDVTACIFWLKNRRPERWREKFQIEDATKEKTEKSEKKKTFAEFCATADYPEPFLKQLEMRDFAFDLVEPRMILGSRGYGKTDYLTILGVAYDVYLHPLESTNLIITKSKERNTAIMKEIANALIKNCVNLEKENSTCVRIQGLLGKDHSVSATTIKTASLRGRHPYRIILDDPVTEDDTSDATRQLVEKKYNEILKLAKKKTPNVLIIGQPAHKHDLYAKLRNTIKVLEVPHGTITELDHDLEAQRLAGVDESSIEMSYYLKVPDDGTTPFDKINYIDAFPVGDSAVAFIDPSHEGGDFTALSIVKSYGQGVAVIGFAWKKAWNHSLDQIFEKLKKYNVRKVCFETNALGDQPIDLMRQSINADIGVIGRRTMTNKHSRIMAAGSLAHQIFLSKESDKVYTDQVVKYEYKAKNDDGPDSLASCLEWIGLIRGKA
jgi:hypothetical protein